MKKITKGAIAAGAATLLLAGGGGTFMAWQDEAGMNVAQTVTAGHLTAEASGDGVWTLNGDDVSDISNVRIVPTDIIKFSQPVTLRAEGDSIQGSFDLTDGSIDPADAQNQNDIDLAEVLKGDAKYAIEIEGEETGLVPVGNDSKAFEFLEPGTYDVNLIAELNFTKDPVTDLMAQGGSVDLSDMSVTVIQETGSEEPAAE